MIITLMKLEGWFRSDRRYGTIDDLLALWPFIRLDCHRLISEPSVGSSKIGLYICAVSLKIRLRVLVRWLTARA